ncbi:unnamed protein product, partial [Phaeothamnion confervicola]
QRVSAASGRGRGGTSASVAGTCVRGFRTDSAPSLSPRGRQPRRGLALSRTAAKERPPGATGAVTGGGGDGSGGGGGDGSGGGGGDGSGEGGGDGGRTRGSSSDAAAFARWLHKDRGALSDLG